MTFQGIQTSIAKKPYIFCDFSGGGERGSGPLVSTTTPPPSASVHGLGSTPQYHRVASTPELATNFIDYKQIAGMTTVRKSCYYTVLSRRYALRWIYFNLNIFTFEIYTQP